MRIIDCLARRMSGAVLMHAAVRGIGLVIRVTSFVAVPVAVIFAVLVVVFSVLRMVGQFAGFVTFAGPEEDEGNGRRDGDRVAENGAHRPDSRHRL